MLTGAVGPGCNCCRCPLLGVRGLTPPRTRVGPPAIGRERMQAIMFMDNARGRLTINAKPSNASADFTMTVAELTSAETTADTETLVNVGKRSILAVRLYKLANRCLAADADSFPLAFQCTVVISVASRKRRHKGVDSEATVTVRALRGYRVLSFNIGL